MFQGNNVKDEYAQIAVFQELSSNPATMDASRCVDALACLPGYSGEQADAEQAYVQADIDNREVTTYVRLPRKYWPTGWETKYKDPVVVLGPGAAMRPFFNLFFF